MGCGTWSWGNRLLWDYDPNQDEEIYEAYKYVRNAGVSVFDTADSYGTLDLNGRAEILLGQFERRYLNDKKDNENNNQGGGDGTNDDIWSKLFSSSSSNGNNNNNNNNIIQPQQVATKFAPYPWRITPNQMVNAAKASLNRLEQDKLSIAQLHWSTANYQPFQEKALWEGIANVYDEDLCDAIGVSNYGPQQLQKISDYMVDRDVPIATAQIQYSLMTFKDCKDMNASCDDINCRLISYSPLCLGLLTGKYNLDNLPRNGNPRRQLFRELLPGAQPLLNTLEVIAKDLDKSQSQVAINWALCKDTVPIPGARTLQQAKENIGAIGWKLDAGMVDELDRAALNLSKPMIQNVFQTK
jgi:pyridoxine 4-dehydrogenase